MCTLSVAVVFVLFGEYQMINAATLKCYFGSTCKAKEVTLNHVVDLVGTPYLDISRPTVIYIYGFLGSEAGPQTNKMLNALLSANDTNVCLVNWEREAKDGIIAPDYACVVQNSIDIGNKFGESLVKLSECGLSLQTLWLIGFSVGAHLMGVAGRKVIELGSIVDRITGCDPSYLGYDEPLCLDKALNKDCATFVDIVHTTDVKFGMVSPTGHIDIYPNRGYYKQHGVQPGCPMGLFGLVTVDEFCSHARAVEYWAQAVITPHGLLASKENSYKQWKASNGAPNDNIYLGKLTNRAFCGKYYLTTNASPPYGKGKDGLRP